ncbi:MAG: EF-hand domain-containing protein [Vampirovibrionales bacterium]
MVNRWALNNDASPNNPQYNKLGGESFMNQLSAHWNQIDTNHDNSIDKAEFKALAARTGGDNGHITMADFNF